jgi:hypothetical protein
LRPLRGASERWRRAARATVGRFVLFGESDAKICATHRANCELSLTTPSMRMVKSAGPNTVAFTKSSTARSTFGRFGRTQPSTSAHADFAAVNVNFWITPDEANLDSKTGSMIVYDLEVPRLGLQKLQYTSGQNQRFAQRKECRCHLHPVQAQSGYHIQFRSFSYNGGRLFSRRLRKPADQCHDVVWTT